MNNIKKLKGIDDEIYAFYLLSKDRLFEKIANKNKLIEKSISCGFTFANSYKGLSIDDLLKKFDLDIQKRKGNESFSYYELAFFEYPNTIVICPNNIGKIKKQGLRHGLDIRVSDVIFAHEIYHKIEEENEGIFTDNTYLDLFKLGPFSKKTKIKSLSEIGAMAFAKKILSIDFNPLLVDFLFYDYYDKGSVFIEKLESLRREYES